MATIAVASSVAAGSYSVTVNGVSGTLNATTAIALIVKSSSGGTLPYAVSVTPSAGSGSANLPQNLTFSWASPAGQPGIEWAQILIQDSAAAPGTLASSCYLRVISTGAVQLADDSGALVLVNSYVGTSWANTLSNSQCKLNGLASSLLNLSNGASTMQVTLNLQFQPAWAGKTLAISMQATNANYQSGAWLPMGTFNVTGAVQPGFKLASSAVTATVGSSGISTIAVTPMNGFNSPVTLTASAWPVGITAGFSVNPATSGSIATINVASSVAPGNYTLTLNGASGALSATTSISLTVNAAGGGGGGTLPYGVSLTPASGSISASVAQNLTATWASPQGQPALDSSWILIQDATAAAGSLANACYLKVFSTGAVELADDAGSIGLTNSFTGNSWALPLSNSHCALNGPSSSLVSVTGAGSVMQVTLNLKFASSWVGKTLSVSLQGTNASYKSGLLTKFGSLTVTP